MKAVIILLFSIVLLACNSSTTESIPQSGHDSVSNKNDSVNTASIQKQVTTEIDSTSLKTSELVHRIEVARMNVDPGFFPLRGVGKLNWDIGNVFGWPILPKDFQFHLPLHDDRVYTFPDDEVMHWEVPDVSRSDYEIGTLDYKGTMYFETRPYPSNLDEVKAKIMADAKKQKPKLNSGVVAFEFYVDENGNLIKPILISAHDPMLTKIVEGHLSELKWNPAVWYGRNIEGYTAIPFPILLDK